MLGGAREKLHLNCSFLTVTIIYHSHLSYFLEILQVNCIQVVDLTPRGATLQWPSLLTAATGYYELWYNSVRTHATGTLQNLSGDSSSVELTDLVPDTPYTVVLLPVSNQRPFNALSVNFSTPSGKRILSFPVSFPVRF